MYVVNELSMNLKDFIESEMLQRGMSQREFAQMVGVSNQTISMALDSVNAPEPSLKFLVRLARATSTDLCSLVALVHPNEVRIDARARIIAERIAQLPPDKQELIDAMLVGFLRSKPGN